MYFIKNMNIVPASRSDEWQRIRVSAYLSLNCENMVRAVGALIKYLEKHYNSGLDMDDSVELGMICSCYLLSIITMSFVAVEATTNVKKEKRNE